MNIVDLKKIIRFVKIYGVVKTWFKVVGRTRINLPILHPRSYKLGRDVGVIGCGQFTFSTVGRALNKIFGNRFVDCYDVSTEPQNTFSDFYNINYASSSVGELLNNNKVKYVYIASNHATHSEYAVQALKLGKVVYIEKPISVTHKQLSDLNHAINSTGVAIYAGYNRPFSAAIRHLKEKVSSQNLPITLNCFVSGHKIPSDHWYRREGEGTRICGNVGHWIDLAVHILSWGKLLDKWSIQLTYSNNSAKDDDMSISMTSSRGDLVIITLTSRCEPFEGINETINFQHDKTICKIDDFRKMQIWQEEKLVTKYYWPKDVGHDRALLQPFQKVSYRAFDEVVMSTLLMLHITKMVQHGETNSSFSFQESMGSLNEVI